VVTQRFDPREFGRAKVFRLHPIALNEFRPGEQFRPSAQDLGPLPRPGALGVHAHDDMEVIAHYRVGGDIDREHRSELLQTLDDPAAPVLEVAAGVVIHAAEIRAPDTARDDVVPGGIVEGDSGAGSCRTSFHGVVLLWRLAPGWLRFKSGCPVVSVQLGHATPSVVCQRLTVGRSSKVGVPGLTTMAIEAAEICTPDTARDDVVPGGIVEGDEGGAGLGHAGLLPWNRVCPKASAAPSGVQAKWVSRG
jgi:hypothetical protein